MGRLQVAIDTRNACRLWPAITTADRGFKIALLNTCEVNVAIAQKELNLLLHRLMMTS